MEEYLILVIDHDSKHLKVLAGYFADENHRYKTLNASSVGEGFEIAKTKKPDLILMEWDMPDISGLEAIRVLKSHKLTNRIPVIMMTGDRIETDVLLDAIKTGAIDFIKTPINRDELIARVQVQLRQVEVFKEYVSQQHLLGKQEKELLEKEKEFMMADVKYHQKQLTMSAVNLLKLSQLLQSLAEEINSLRPYTNEEGGKRIKAMSIKINDKSNERIWNEFEVCFERVRNNFYQKLIEKIPDISIREKRLCAFLTMNMSTKEIASITFQSVNSIDVAKHRLRKKLGINTAEEFNNFLLSL
jgi:DNA-binding response OmpR family regulator/DNA-binding CsgD family transcriptional regulator